MSGISKCRRAVGLLVFFLLALPVVGRAQCSASFSYQIGDAAASPAAQACTLTAGAVPLAYTASPSAGWIQVSPVNGTVQANASFNLTISASPVGLSAGSYSGSILITALGYQSITIPVYLTVADPPPQQNSTISASPAALAFAYQRGGSNPSSQTFNVTSGGAALNYTVSVQGANWLAANVAAGTTPGGVTISVNPLGLADNTYTAQVVIQAAGSANASVAVTVSLTVSTPTPIMLSRGSLSFAYAIGDPFPAFQAVSVTSNPSGATFAVSADGGSNGWLRFSVDKSRTPATLTVAVTPDKLPPGAYNSTIRVTLSGSGAQASVQVSLSVAGTISFTYQPATGAPQPKCFAFSDPAGQPFTVLTSSQAWFSVQPLQGTAPASICVSVAAQDLAPGDYSGVIAISSGVGLTVALKVLPPPSLQLNTGSMTFAPPQAGALIPWQWLNVSSANPDQGAQFTVVTDPSAPWLQVSALSGTTPAQLTVSANASGLQAGTYTSSITVSLAGVTAGAQTVGVTLQVPPPVILTVTEPSSLIARPGALSFSYQPGFFLPSAQTLQISGGLTPISASASTVSGGSWLAVSPAAGTTPAAFTIAVIPQGLAPGTYRGTLRIDSQTPTVNGVTVPVTLAVTASATPTVSPSSLTLRAQAGASQPASGHLVVDTDGDTLPVSVTATGGSWLSVDPPNFTVGSFDNALQAAAPSPKTLTVLADASGLTPGTYNGSIVLSYGDGSSPVTVAVTLKVRSSTLIVPQVADGGGWKTSILLANTDWVPAPFTIRFLSPDGSPMVVPLAGIGTVSEYTGSIPVGGSQWIQTQGTGSNLVQGWAEVVAQKSLGGTVVFRQQTAGGASEAAVSISSPIGKQFSLPFDNSNGFATGMAIVNPGTTAATMSVTLRDESGQLLGTDTLSMNGRSRQAVSLPGRFPESGGIKGVITFSNTTNDVAGFALRFNPRSSFTAIQAIPQVSATGGIITRTIPQVADGSRWKTTIVLVNPTSDAAPYSLAFRQADGAPLSLPLLGAGPASESSGSIPAGGVKVIETDGTSSDLLQGWAEVVSTKPIMGTAVFRERSVAGLDSEAAVQVAPSPGDRLVLPFDNTQGFVSALAVLNESTSDALQMGVVIRDENGLLLWSSQVRLDPCSRQAFTLPARFPASAGTRGTIELSGSHFSVLGLRFSPAGTFTSVTPLSR